MSNTKRPCLRIVVAAVLAAAHGVPALQAQQPAARGDDQEKKKDSHAKKLHRDLQKLGDGTFARNLEGVAAELIEAAEKIEVHPAAERAGAAIARSRFDKALRLCNTALDADKADPYALYLAGIAAAELDRFDDARKFVTVHRSKLLKTKRFRGLMHEKVSQNRLGAKANGPFS